MRNWGFFFHNLHPRSVNPRAGQKLIGIHIYSILDFAAFQKQTLLVTIDVSFWFFSTVCCPACLDKIAPGLKRAKKILFKMLFKKKKNNHYLDLGFLMQTLTLTCR